MRNSTSSIRVGRLGRSMEFISSRPQASLKGITSKLSKKRIVIAALLISAAFFTAALFTLIFQRNSPPVQAAAVTPVVKEEPSSESAPDLELHIANNGLVYLEGARVVSVSNSEIDVKTAWGSSEFHWTINIDNGTRFILKNGERGTIQNIEVGDHVSISGPLEGNTPQLTISAESVRNTTAKNNSSVVHLDGE